VPRTKKISFLNFINRKYNKMFTCFDDYSMWLFYEKFNKNAEEYYYELEEDLILYVENQEKIYGRKKV